MPFDCEISFDPTAALVYNLSSIFAGLTILEKEGLIKIKKVNHVFDFKKSGKYPNRLIVEINIEGKIIAIDISDGYQDIHSPEFFDSILNNVDYYFKTNYDPVFASKLINKDKFKQFGLLFRGTYPGNIFEKEMAKYYFHNKDYKSAIFNFWFSGKYQKSESFENFISDNHYENYNVLMWTRLWDQSASKPENIMKVYPELTWEQAVKKSKDSVDMHTEVNKERIDAVRLLKENLGERFIGGLSDSEESRILAPELIATDKRVVTRNCYIETLKSNVINILSKGLHGCIGARYCETFAAGRAFITDKLVYQLYGNVLPNQNYIEYTSAENMVDCVYDLLENTDKIREMELNNSKYYNDYLRPDVLMKRVISTVAEDF